MSWSSDIVVEWPCAEYIVCHQRPLLRLRT
jgi:hypothetical protein